MADNRNRSTNDAESRVSHEAGSAAAFADDPHLTDAAALILLKRRDLPAEVLTQLAQNPAARKNRQVMVALAAHPHTPRRVSLPLMRQLFCLELMQVTLDPGAAPDVRHLAEELLVGRLKEISAGERMTLARRGSGRVAAALLLDSERRIVEAALNNGHLVEADVVKALTREDTSSQLTELVCRQEKWWSRREVRSALLRNPHTPLARALECANGVQFRELKDILHASRLPESTKAYLQKELEERAGRCAPPLLEKIKVRGSAGGATDRLRRPRASANPPG
jgi:hypothetical protein